MPNELILLFFFFFNDSATTEIHTFSLHDALPISRCPVRRRSRSRLSRATCSADGPERRRSEEQTSELQSHSDLVCRLLLEKKKIAVGPGRIDDKNNRVPIDVKFGDTVLYSKYGGTEVKYAGEDYLVFSSRYFLADIDK